MKAYFYLFFFFGFIHQSISVTLKKKNGKVKLRMWKVLNIEQMSKWIWQLKKEIYYKYLKSLLNNVYYPAFKTMYSEL